MKRALCLLSMVLSLTAGQTHADMNNYLGYTSGEISVSIGCTIESLYIDLCNCLFLICSLQHRRQANYGRK
ncbi:Uncharacterised protein [Escherichia coli]|nr:Uncharacterised protein [Escherichia coli]